jgi:hypothetical protein
MTIQLPSDPLEPLLREMKQTKGARFNAATRLEDRDRQRTTLIAYASVSVVVVTLLPAFFDVPAWVRNAVSLATIAMSLIILAYSMLQAQSRDSLVAYQLHKCALEINSLRREIRALTPSTPAQVSEYTRRYDDILGRYSVNHDPVDYEKYKLEHPEEFAAISDEASIALKREVGGTEPVLGLITGLVIATIPGFALAVLASKSEALIHWLKALVAAWASS